MLMNRLRKTLFLVGIIGGLERLVKDIDLSHLPYVTQLTYTQPNFSQVKGEEPTFKHRDSSSPEKRIKTERYFQLNEDHQNHLVEKICPIEIDDIIRANL